MAQAARPQAPNPGPAPFQQSNAGLAAAQGGGGPSPVAALVAATQKPRQRTQRPAPQQGPRADFSGIQQAGSAIGNALREKYQREFDEKMADKAHQHTLEQQTNMSKLQEAVINKSAHAAEKNKITEGMITTKKNQAQRNYEAHSIARQARNQGLEFAAQQIMPENLREFDGFFSMGQSLFDDSYAHSRFDKLRLDKEVPEMYQVMSDSYARDLGVDPGEPMLDVDPYEPTARRVKRADVINGSAGEGLTPLMRGVINTESELAVSAFAADWVSIEEQLAIREIKELGFEGARQAMAQRLLDRNAGLTKAMDFQEGKRDRYLQSFGVSITLGKDGERKVDTDAIVTHVLSETKRLVLDHFTRDSTWRDNASLQLPDAEIKTLIQGFFTGENSELAGRFIDIIMAAPPGETHQVWQRMADSMQPGGDTSLGQWSPAFMSSMNLIFTQIVVGLESMEGDAGDIVEGHTASEGQVSNWATAYQLDSVEPHEARLLQNSTHSIKDIAERGQSATNHGGNMDYVVNELGGALWLHRAERARSVNQETQGNLIDDFVDSFNDGSHSMPLYIGADLDLFSRNHGEYFRVLGGIPLPEGVVGPPAPQQALDQLPPGSAPPGTLPGTPPGQPTSQVPDPSTYPLGLPVRP